MVKRTVFAVSTGHSRCRCLSTSSLFKFLMITTLTQLLSGVILFESKRTIQIADTLLTTLAVGQNFFLLAQTDNRLAHLCVTFHLTIGAGASLTHTVTVKPILLVAMEHTVIKATCQKKIDDLVNWKIREYYITFARWTTVIRLSNRFKSSIDRTLVR